MSHCSYIKKKIFEKILNFCMVKLKKIKDQNIIGWLMEII